VSVTRASSTADDLVVRPLQAGEEELFLSFVDPGLVGVQSIGRDYRELVGLGQYRPEWTWVALRGGRVVGRGAWWGGPGDPAPQALDWFDFGDDLDVGVALLRAAPFRAEYCLVLPPRWRDDPATLAAGEVRIAAARRAGMRQLVERLHYRWTPADALPERPGRLEFRPPPGDDAVLGILRRVVEGSLDAHMRDTTARRGADAAARDEMDFLNWMPSPREWWRVARTRDGEMAGFIAPGRNHAGPIIGIVGVVPEHRGNGYAYDLLVEATHVLTEQRADKIDADTDTTNTPMAATFARAGYPITQRRIFLHWPT
jgi:RimJ/RimL family protein N-acetyltransferase